MKKPALIYVRHNIEADVWLRMGHKERHEATNGEWPWKEEMGAFNITKSFAKNRDKCGARRCKEEPKYEVLSDCWDDIESGDYVQLCTRHFALAEKEYQMSSVEGASRKISDIPTYKSPEKKDTDAEMVALVKREESEAVEVRDLTREFSIETQDDLEFAAEALSQSKASYKELKSKQDEILAPMKTASARVKKLFKPALDSYLEVEKTLKSLILEARAREESDREQALELAADGNAGGALEKLRHTSNISSLSTRKKLVVEITDPDKVPPMFLTPDVVALRAWFMEDKSRVDDEDKRTAYLVEWGITVKWETTLASK